jgi:hypothetical protein
MDQQAANNKRDFKSYLDEYLLQTTEVEINAFWQRMDKEMANMPEAERIIFFEKLFAGMDESLVEIEKLKAKLLAKA